MRFKTMELAAKLPGTQWERDGKLRYIHRVEELRESLQSSTPVGLVYWSRPVKPERAVPKWLPYFNDWLAKAEPANDAARAFVEEAAEAAGGEE